MDVKFYKCMHCGNIAVKVFDAGVPLVCCGEKMVELVADSQDAALEKHVPAVEVEGNKVIVNVGSVDHPMLEEHWIQFIRSPRAMPPTLSSSSPRARRRSRSTSTATSTVCG